MWWSIKPACPYRTVYTVVNVHDISSETLKTFQEMGTKTLNVL